MSQIRSIRATVLQTPTADRLEVLEDQLIEVDELGRIVSMRPALVDDKPDVTLGSSKVLLPGLIDTHIHAPQWPQLGTGLDMALERWLFEYTFPLEARFADESFAVSVWDQMVPTLLRLGTTTAVYYSSNDLTATTALARACVQHGQRAFVGRVAMDHPEGTPDYYRDESPSASVAASAASIDEIHAVAGDEPGALVQPIITPRFVPACTDAALSGLAELAAASGVRVQTHCSESDWQHGAVIERHGCTDTESLERFGLIRDHTVLAHATHLNDADRSILAAAGAGVAHCPLSNSYFSNAVFGLRKALDAGVRVGLGTDIAGGPKASLFANCEHAVTVSRMLEDGVDVELDENRGVPDSRVDTVTAFWCATVGGAELLGIDAGLLTRGRFFDAVAVDLEALPAFQRSIDLPDRPRLFEKVVRGLAADSVAISDVWVAGRRVAGL